jgi:hypothetical protein
MQFSLGRLLTVVTVCGVAIGLARGVSTAQPPYSGLSQLGLFAMLLVVTWIAFNRAMARR